MRTTDLNDEFIISIVNRIYIGELGITQESLGHLGRLLKKIGDEDEFSNDITVVRAALNSGEIDFLQAFMIGYSACATAHHFYDEYVIVDNRRSD